MTVTTPTLAETISHAEAAADRAIAFCRIQDFPLGAALIAHRWRNGAADEVIAALEAYQNPDGGFGNRLEVDIAAPESNPFATLIAMQALVALNDRPASAAAMLARLDRYLATAQDEAGDFRFSDAVLAGELAPWFAGWTFPNLNPSASIAGFAHRLGIGSPVLFSRVEAMISSLADPDEARSGEFYAVLPYVDYSTLLAANGHDTLFAATVKGITARMNRDGGYDDAGHALHHALGGGPVLASRIPMNLLAQEAARLVAEQQDDGGWPSPYSAAWRPWVTASAFIQLAVLWDMSREV